MDFVKRLNQVEKHVAARDYDLAWKLANEFLEELRAANDPSWFMMYYQMSLIRWHERKWLESLEKMALTVHHLGRVGGLEYTKHIQRLLGKFDAIAAYDEFVKLALGSDPKVLGRRLESFLDV